MTADEAENFILTMCEYGNLIEEPEYAIFIHRILGEKGLTYEFRTLYLEENLNIEEACTCKLQNLPHKSILLSLISDSIMKSDEKLNLLLIEVIHAMYCDVFAEEIMEKLGFDNEDSEGEDNPIDTINEEEMDLTEEEKALFLEVIKYSIDFEFKCMQRELKKLLDELAADKIETENIDKL